jgi:hypothetical protein
VTGTGAGTFETWWLEHRARAQQIRDAHSLYLEVLGELGIVGLLLLVAALAVPLAAGVGRRAEPLVPVALAAYAAWLVHAGVDWDWEIPAVTLSALACAVCCTAGGRSFVLGRSARIAVGSASAVVALFAIVVAIGNNALAASRNALHDQNYARAETEAKRASRWAPWASEPWIIRGQILALGREQSAARAAFRKAIAKDPRSYLAWYGLAGVETGAARLAAAAEVRELNPESDEAKQAGS